MLAFSIVLPVKNGGAYVKDCIKSLLSQTYPSYDILVLDNNSTDGTLEWVRSIQSSRIRIIESKTSLSIEQNWARIKDYPRNEYMTVIGHDDLLDPEYLAVMVDLIGQYPDASLYQTHFRYIDSQDGFIRKSQPMDIKQYTDGFLKGQIFKTQDSTGTGYLMRTKDYDALGGIPVTYPNLIYADYELWVRLTLLSYKATSPRECFSYRIHSSVSALTNGETYQDAFGKYVTFLSKVRQQDPAIHSVLTNHGKRFLMDSCEGLSHRILKTALSNRKISVWIFIKKCKAYAELLIPGQSFHPLLKPRILLAMLLDNKWGIKLFWYIKKISQ